MDRGIGGSDPISPDPGGGSLRRARDSGDDRRGRRRARGGARRSGPAGGGCEELSSGASEAAEMAFRRRSGRAGQPGDDGAASGPGVGLGGKGIGARCVGAPPIQIARGGKESGDRGEGG